MKIAPNCGGQWRRQASQLMHSDISMRSGGFFHFGLRWSASRSLDPGAALPRRRDSTCPASIDPPVKDAGDLTVWTRVGHDGRRLTEQGRERKQQLLDRRGTLFAERGYADTRVVDICEAAGVAKGLFYWYFENKEALFAELVRTMRLRLRRAQADAMDPDADPLTRIRQGAEASRAVHGRATRRSSRCSRSSTPIGRSPSSAGRHDVHVADAVALIAEGSAGLVRDDGAPELLALGVVGAVAYFTHFHRTGRITIGVDELATYVGRWVVKALAGEVPARLADPRRRPRCGWPEPPGRRPRVRAAPQPMAMRGCWEGFNQRMSATSVDAVTETQPAVGPPVLTCRKIAEPAPGVTGKRL